MKPHIRASIFGWNPQIDDSYYLLSDEHRPPQARPVTDEEARECLWQQRRNIADAHVRRVVDFVLGRKDVQIMYIGGNATLVNDKGEENYGSSVDYTASMGCHHIEMSTRVSSGVLAHECFHTVSQIMYENNGNPYKDDGDAVLFIGATLNDTGRLKTRGSELRDDLGIDTALYYRKDFNNEISARIIQKMADGEWSHKLRNKYPYLTAYIEKIVLQDLAIQISGRKGFTPRPKSLDELVSTLWPPTAEALPDAWKKRAGKRQDIKIN